MAPRRRLLLWGALVLTLAAVVWVDRGDDPGPAKKRPRQAAPAQVGAGAAPLSAADLARKEYTAGRGDLFAARSWAPPPTAEVAAPAGPPPLPFAYIGRLYETGGTVLFLLHQERTLAVRQGDVIDGAYRVEKITPQTVVMLYLPLKQKQSLDLGSAN